jgi:hypothetical protein
VESNRATLTGIAEAKSKDPGIEIGLPMANVLGSTLGGHKMRFYSTPAMSPIYHGFFLDSASEKREV